MIGLIAICGKCFIFASSYLYLAYGLIVAFLSLLDLDKVSEAPPVNSVSPSKLPPIPGELSFFQPKSSISAQILARLMLDAFSVDAFRRLVQSTVKFIRVAFLMKDNPSPVRSFLRYLNLYLIIVPLPAALFWPVLHTQRTLDFQLVLAAILMMVVNAAGDAVSIRFFLRNFEHLPFGPIETGVKAVPRFWASAQSELAYFLKVAKGTGYSLAVLIVVLALSSVLFGVQTGQFDIELSARFAAGAWNRITHFYDIAFEPYWIMGRPAPFATKGFPGLFLYGIITFIPMIVLFMLTALWTLLLPIRLALTFPGGTVARVIMSELSVILLCIAVTHFLNVDFVRLYNFLMHS